MMFLMDRNGVACGWKNVGRKKRDHNRMPSARRACSSLAAGPSHSWRRDQLPRAARHATAGGSKRSPDPRLLGNEPNENQTWPLDLRTGKKSSARLWSLGYWHQFVGDINDGCPRVGPFTENFPGQALYK